MSAYDDEQARREQAWQRRDDSEEDSTTLGTPTRLETILSVRLDPELEQAVSDYAQRLGWTTSQVIRYALSQVVQPTGWVCKHVNWTSKPGMLDRPSTGCGCEMQPVYHLSGVAA